MLRIGSALAALTLLFLTPRLEAQTLGAGPITIRLSGRVQTQFNTTSVDERDFDLPHRATAGSTFETRRVRFGFDAVVDDWISGRFEPEYAMGKLALRLAYVNLAFDPRFEVRMGQYKKPFSLLFLTSSTEILPIERGLRIRGLEGAARRRAEQADGSGHFFSFGDEVVLGEEQRLLEALSFVGYDLGASVHGQLGKFRYEVGLFNGEGSDRRDVDDAKAWAGRLTFQPRRDLPLVLGTAVSHEETVFTGTIDDVHVEHRRLSGTAYEVDAAWGAFRRPGLRLLAEAVVGNNLALDEPFRAAQANAGYYLPLASERVEGLEPTFRLSFADPNTGRHDDHGWLITPGFNLYFAGKNRLMLNWDVFVSGSEAIESENALRMQAQVAF